MSVYCYRAKAVSPIKLVGPFSPDQLIKQFSFSDGRLEENLRDKYEIFELVPAKIIPPNEAKVVRA